MNKLDAVSLINLGGTWWSSDNAQSIQMDGLGSNPGCDGGYVSLVCHNESETNLVSLMVKLIIEPGI